MDRGRQYGVATAIGVLVGLVFTNYILSPKFTLVGALVGGIVSAALWNTREIKDSILPALKTTWSEMFYLPVFWKSTLSIYQSFINQTRLQKWPLVAKIMLTFGLLQGLVSLFGFMYWGLRIKDPNILTLSSGMVVFIASYLLLIVGAFMVGTRQEQHWNTEEDLKKRAVAC